MCMQIYIYIFFFEVLYNLSMSVYVKFGLGKLEKRRDFHKIRSPFKSSNERDKVKSVKVALTTSDRFLSDHQF